MPLKVGPKVPYRVVRHQSIGRVYVQMTEMIGRAAMAGANVVVATYFDTKEGRADAKAHAARLNKI